MDGTFSTHERDDNIKYIMCVRVNWIHQPQYWDQWVPLANTVINLELHNGYEFHD